MKRQANALTAVLENWQDVENAIDIYANSAGSALRENEIYLDSWEAKSKAVGAAWNEFVNSFVNSEWIKDFLDGAQATLSFLTETEAAIGVLAGVITGVLVAAVLKGTFTIEGFNAAMLKANILSGGIPLLLGLLTTVAVGVVSWGISASDTAKQIENLTTKIEEQQRTIDELNSKEKEATDLYKEYASLMSKSNAYGLTADEKENLLNISNQLVDTYGLEVQGIDAVTGAYVIGTSAINDYVEALRAERLEKQKEQTDTRNKRIKKNLDSANGNVSPSDVDDVIKNIQEGLKFGTPLPTILSDYNDETLQDIIDYAEGIGKTITELTYEELENALIKSTVRYGNFINSVIKDVITNIQVENADTMTQSGENILTSMMQSILPNIDDLDRDKIKEIQDNISSFAKEYGHVFDDLGLKNQQIQEKINSNTVGIKDYKDLLDNQMKQLQVIEQIFGATSEEANAFRDQLNESIGNNTGLSFAQIAKTMSESDLDTTQFDKVTSAILKLDKAMSSGEITFSEYMDELESATKDISLEDTFKGDTQSAKQFFGVLTTKGKSAIQNLAAQMQNGEISQKDYLTGIEDIVDYLSSLSTQSLNIFGADDETTKEINSIVEGISTAKTELEAFKGVIQLMPDTFAEMQAMGTSAVNNLATALENAGITSLEVGDKVYQGSKQIAQAIKTDEAAFTAAQKKIAEETKNRLVAIGTGVAKLINGMINLFGDMSIKITPPKYRIWDWIKQVITGNSKDLEFKVAVGGTVDEGAFGNLFADSFGDIDWGFDDFTGGGGGNPPPYTPPGGKDKDKDKPEYEDPTDAIINRINLRSKEIEKQEEEIQNLIEIAELENDYKKQISLTNDLIAKRKERLSELENAKWWHHNEAEYLRNSTPQWNEEEWFDSQGNATEAYTNFINNRITAGADKEEIESIKDQFEKISKYKKAWIDVDNEIAKLNKEILQAEENLFDARKKGITDTLSHQASQLSSLKSLTQSHYDVMNSIADAQNEINKELKASQTMYEYLDEDTRKLLFNQEDYNELSEELLGIQRKAEKLQRKYNKDIRNATANELDEITSQYEMQYELLMKQYETSKAELEVAKKRQQLNNVLNERNTRMFINGQWQWVANTEDVINAQNELADAKYAQTQAKNDVSQTKELNKIQLAEDKLNTAINNIESGVVDFNEEVGNLTGGLAFIQSYDIPALHSICNDASAAIKKFAEELTEATLQGTLKFPGGNVQYSHADGTRSTKAGLTLVGEGKDPFEVIATKYGLLSVAQPTLGNFGNGSIVFNQDQLDGMRNVWDMANVYSKRTLDTVHQGRAFQNVDNSNCNNIYINGMQVSNDADGKALNDALRRYVATHR